MLVTGKRRSDALIFAISHEVEFFPAFWFTNQCLIKHYTSVENVNNNQGRLYQTRTYESPIDAIEKVVALI